MERINGQTGGWKELAEKALFWIIYAKRPLITSELQHALAVESGDSELHIDGIPYIEDIVSVCAGLVTVDKESNIIRLVHYTAEQYFEQTQEYWFPHAEINITTTCITYLSFDVFDRGFCQTDDEFEERLRSNQFFKYAVRNWGHHARKASTTSQTLSQAVVDFLMSEAKVNVLSQGLFAIKYDSSHSDYSQQVPRKMTGLHLTAYFRLEAVVKLLLETGKADADLKDDYSQTPLSLAAENGHEAVVKLLLVTGKVDADAKSRYDQTPLSFAAENGHEAIVKLLLETGKADADAKGRCDQTPLSFAAEGGHEAIVKLLLETGKVDADSKDDYSRTPLSYAAQNGHDDIVKLLLETGRADADAKGQYDRTPLSYAAQNGHEDIVKLLLETGKVRINAKGQSGRTPLLYAAQSGHEAVVKLLRKHVN
jgi:ankyrin repeat protein